MKTKNIFTEESNTGIIANQFASNQSSNFFGIIETLKLTMFVILVLFAGLSCAFGQTKKDGTPDMRYSANKQSYGTSYSTSTNSSVRYQSGYTKSNGTAVQSHYKTTSNNTNWDNYSSAGNSNPHTGSVGSKAKDYTPAASNYGSGKTIYEGPKGGQYYHNDNGNKTYVPKR